MPRRENTDEKASFILAEMRRNDRFRGLSAIAPAVEELSHDWHDAFHFTARDNQSGSEVVIKVGVAPAERYWTKALALAANDIVPELFADGEITGPAGEPLEFIATEKLPYSLIGERWFGRQADLLLAAGARFQAACRTIEQRYAAKLTLSDILAWLGEGGERNPPGNWRNVAENALEDFAWLEAHFPFEACHGDLHVGNAFSRNPPPSGPALLIDINPVFQPWVFDAAWVATCDWRSLDRIDVLSTVKQLARCRAEVGLDIPAEEIVERAGRIALSWHAIRLWDPDHLDFMPGFQEATEAFINAGASLPR